MPPASAIEATTAPVGEEEEMLYRLEIHTAPLAMYEARGCSRRPTRQMG